MPRKRQNADVTDIENPEVPSVESSENNKPARSVKPRLSIPLKADGSIDFDSMQGGTREKFQQAMSMNPNAAEVKVSLRVNRDFIPHMYDSMCAGIQLGGKTLFHWPEGLTRHMTFTEEEKEKLTEPTARVIEKYAPEWLLTHQEEFALCQAIIVASKSMVERATMRFVLESQQTQLEVPGKEV